MLILLNRHILVAKLLLNSELGNHVILALLSLGGNAEWVESIARSRRDLSDGLDGLWHFD